MSSSSNKNLVVVVGSANEDLIGYSPKFPEAGETIISRNDKSNNKKSTFEVKPGGKGANQAVSCGKLLSSSKEFDVEFICKIGKDKMGESILENLQNSNVRYKPLYAQNSATGVAMITVNTESGDNTIVVHSGANSELSPMDIRLAFDSFSESIKVVLVQLEIPLESALEALKLAKAKNSITILNPAPVSSEPLSEIWEYVDIVVPNQVELKALMKYSSRSDHSSMQTDDDETEEQIAKSFLKSLDKKLSVITTLGSKGAMIVSSSSPENVNYCNAPMTIEDPVLDTIGAGDAFCGALATYLALSCSNAGDEIISTNTLKQATTFACGVASLSVRSHGAQSSYPTFSQLPSDILRVIEPALSSASSLSSSHEENEVRSQKPIITFITGNMNKLKEVQRLFSLHPSFPYDIKHCKIDIPEYQGDSPIEIAIQKCHYAYKEIQSPVFIEDTSLCFSALQDLPGPYIKWFLQKLKLQGLNQLLAGYDDKSAYAMTILAYKKSIHDDVQVFCGKTYGTIVPPRGKTDFGWDAIFETSTKDDILKTYGEMSLVEKNLISHRKKAFDCMTEFLVKDFQSS